jgi:Zn finger protein HypA/HybF involved in hydrogenase expression
MAIRVIEPKYIVVCWVCGWMGKRTEFNIKPCPRCKSHKVYRVQKGKRDVDQD